jgi:hypothetical protein
MASARDLAKSFSFIPQFLADTGLAAYGDNALPVYSVALYLDVEDIPSFASESLTDHSSDKKADIIYIDEAEGIALIAQGYMGKKWGKKEAPAKKASDLSTAAAWLLQQPINQVPAAIRSQAKLLRDALKKQTVTKVVFAYAHNSLESPNVKAELDAVVSLVSGLDCVKGTNVEAIELGLRQTEALYLNSRGIIQVLEEIDLPAASLLSEKGAGWQAYVLSLNGALLSGLYENHKNALFSANLRDFLGARKSSRNVNNNIQDTAQKKPSDFFVLNNGVTLVTKKAEFIEDQKVLRITGVSVVNGAQTTGALHAAGTEHAKNVSVLARVITVDKPEMIRTIVTGNNTQNSIAAWDRRSNDPIQIRIKNEFDGKGVTYVHRRDASRHTATSIFADQVGQMLCAFGGDLQTAIRAKAEIFESDVAYMKVFPSTISIGHIFAIQTLGWAYDKIKSELKTKSDKGKSTKIEQDQLRLLDFSASKQFLVSVVGRVREEVAGKKVTDFRQFEIKPEAITITNNAAVAAWEAVLKSVVPIIATNLPAEEYEVVRSSEHTETVAIRTKGVVAGVGIIQNNFKMLQSLLSPT